MSVLSEWGLRCPKCERDDQLDIVALAHVRLTEDGTDHDEARNGDHEWDDESDISCGCGWEGKVADARAVEE